MKLEYKSVSQIESLSSPKNNKKVVPGKRDHAWLQSTAGFHGKASLRGNVQ